MFTNPISRNSGQASRPRRRCTARCGKPSWSPTSDSPAIRSVSRVGPLRARKAGTPLLREMWEAKLGTKAISYHAALGAVPAPCAAIRACEVCWQRTTALDLLKAMLEARADPTVACDPAADLYVHGAQAGGPMDVCKHIMLVASR
ncbi:unnamed protein product [Prorocentrum cordatum]|uniref:Uncharacterized protein n=1 Tax=Prorocentrum cordatum TaxID=2364126 RepID=A0ABN9SQ98_9DINO|nr:unnamed protein product [Polarella glacialis]